MSGHDIDVSVFDELSRCHRASARYVAARLDLLMGVPLARFLALRAIATAEGTMVPADVATVLGCSRANVGPIVKTMHERCWITRGHHPLDGRLVCLRLTPHGKRVYDDLAYELAHATRSLIGALDDDEKDSFVDMLRKITAQARE